MMGSLVRQLSWWRTVLFHRFFPAAALKRNLGRDNEAEVELRLLPALVPPNRIAIDVGANVGSYTGALIPLCDKVIAVEPHPRLARLLRAFPKDKVETIEAVASAAAGAKLELEVSLTGPRESDALGHVAKGPSQGNVRRFSVKTITLDQFANEQIGFVKIDVEGHELDVLRGAHELLKAQRPTLLIESEARHCEGAPWVLFEELERAGYSGFFCNEGRTHSVSEFDLELQNEELLIGYTRRDQADYVNNFIFVPNERQAEDVRSQCDEVLGSL